MTGNRPPIVVILGHVDHGKTTLLDALRKTDIASSEAGGITQSVRSFQLTSPFMITFIDTPGHEAFSAMRSRGGKVADLALLVVAGDDGVKPQTKESMATITTAQIPYIVVVTKSDLAEFNLDKVKTQLAENQVLVEGFGGDIPLVAVSAKTGRNLVELLELIQLVSQLHPVVVDDQAGLEAVVLESRLDSKRGPVAVVIVKNGTLRSGQELYLGQHLIGKAKALTATSGERVDSAGPSTPVEILGVNQVPPVGSVLNSEAGVDKLLAKEEVPDTKNLGEKNLKLVLKVDTLGSLEAVQTSLPGGVDMVSAGTGDITESDILLAQSTGATVAGFGVKVPTSVVKLAEIEKVRVVTSKIIYELLEQIELLVHPKEVEKIVGKAEVLAEFKMNGQRIAGCKCSEGEFKKSGQVRSGEKLTRIKSLRVGKVETESVKQGQEFGAVFGLEVDFKVGDIIIAVESYG